MADTALPRIENGDEPYAMANPDGDRFYPDNPEDAAYFAEHHNAQYLHTPPTWPTSTPGGYPDDGAGQGPIDPGRDRISPRGG